MESSPHDPVAGLLLIEDNPGDARLIREMCIEADEGGIRLAATVPTLADAFAALDAMAPDLILLDLNLPDSTGESTLRAMLEKTSGHVPIIVLTGLDDAALGLHAIGAGAQDFLVKGQFDERFLARVIRYALERHRLSGQLRRTNRALQAIAHCNQALVSATDEEQLLRDVCRIIVENGGYQLMWAGYLETDATRAVRPVAHFGHPTEYTADLVVTWDDSPTGNGPAGIAIRSKAPCIVADAATDPRFVPWRQKALSAGIQSVAAFPLCTQDSTLGVIVIFSHQPNTFDARETNRLFQLANDLAYGIQSLRTRANLEALSQQLARRVEERTAELREANAVLQTAVQVKDRFLAHMSHELRTPLNGILMLAETLTSGIFGALNPKQAQAAQGIAESGRHLLSLINDVLDLTKINAEVLQLEPSLVQIEPVIASAKILVKQLAAHKRISIATAIDPAVTTICADATRLKQILLNLLSNAIEFTPADGKVGIDVQSDGETVEISVWDTGIGIATADLPRLFQPFTQLDDSLHRQHEGTGLGLVLVRRLAELHGGGVAVQSSLGAGSRFTVSLPLVSNLASSFPAVVADEITDTTTIVAAPTPHAHNGHRLLLAEDNAANRIALAAFLEGIGYTVDTAGDGDEALAKATAGPFDAFLLDIQMPKTDGLEVTRQLKANPATRQTPVIALTALAMKGDRERCLDAGADEYVSKPVNLRELHGIIQKLIARPAP